MIPPSLPDAARFAANHLWQSTLVAGLAALLVRLLRRSEARIRHAVWLAASVKFLVPFALLAALGSQLAPPRFVTADPAPAVTMLAAIGQPFAPRVATAPAPHRLTFLPCLVALWLCGVATIALSSVQRWRRVQLRARSAELQHAGREFDLLRRVEIAARARRPTPLLLSLHRMEPGVFGVLRPALLWPVAISPHLDDAQLAAIFAHEICHVRRRDNLASLAHMLVEVLFWFHPLVWWIGTRLLEERERACDEAVLRMGNEPALYAEAILKACRFCAESPLPSIAGVSGSDLKQRMVRIMNDWTVPLTRSRKLLLAALAISLVAAPVVIGALQLPVIRTDVAPPGSTAGARFDSASLKPAQVGSGHEGMLLHGGEFIDNNVTVRELIAVAYGVKPDRITGGPDWVSTRHFDFEAHWTPRASSASPDSLAPPPPPPPPAELHASPTSGPGPRLQVFMAPGEMEALLRNFLAERLNLRLRGDSAVLPTYELVIANGGARLTPTSQTPPPPHDSRGAGVTYVSTEIVNGQQRFAATNAGIRVLADMISTRLGREVVDKTALTGKYNLAVFLPGAEDTDQFATALRDQLGLDLQSSQGPVGVFAIDNIHPPAAE